MEFQVFVERKGNVPDPLEVMMNNVKDLVGEEISVEIFDINTKNGKEQAKKRSVEEVPSLLFEKVKISGQVNEYFILACVAQLLTNDGNDQTGSEIELTDNNNHLKLKVASAFMTHQTQIREETTTYLMAIRSTTDEFNVDVIENLANSGTTIFLLTNFEEGSQNEELASIGAHEKILMGHIMRSNIHMTMAITVRKGRPFFGAYVRTKQEDAAWKGNWSPLLHDTVSELKDFYVPLFNTSSPVHLDGTIPEPMEVNRLVAKVKDNIEILRALFF